MSRASRTVGIIVARQKHEAIRMSLRQCGYPIRLGSYIRSGEKGIGNPFANRGVECVQLLEMRRRAVGLGPDSSPAGKSIRLVADLEGEEIRAERAWHIGRLLGCFFRCAAREVQPVDQLPLKDAHGRSKTIDVRWCNNESVRCH